MSSRRIHFTAWGSGHFTAPAYAYHDEWGECESVADSVARAVARKSRLDVVTLRPEGHAVERGEIVSSHYVTTLGKHLRSGGWSWEAEVWFAIPTARREVA